MKRRWLLPFAAAGLSMLLMASAGAQDLCTPVEPKKWEGTLLLGEQGWVGTTLFSQGCSWNGADAVNGTDVIVWDVSGYGGVTASITSKQAVGAVHSPLLGYFYNEECQRGGHWGFTEANTPYAVGIPEGAKWFVAYQQYGGAQTTVTMETAGRTCEDVETPKPPKKKKKPRRP
ncbi:MAG TPA: hypothetical protein VG318_09235 [Actinomycetota bacterium]|nr:hypothetical protein [Actinomycetota bacterium]